MSVPSLHTVYRLCDRLSTADRGPWGSEDRQPAELQVTTYIAEPVVTTMEPSAALISCNPKSIIPHANKTFQPVKYFVWRRLDALNYSPWSSSNEIDVVKTSQVMLVHVIHSLLAHVHVSTIFSRVSAHLRVSALFDDPMVVHVYMRYTYKRLVCVSAHPVFWAINFKRPCTLTRENTVVLPQAPRFTQNQHASGTLTRTCHVHTSDCSV